MPPGGAPGMTMPGMPFGPRPPPGPPPPSKGIPSRQSTTMQSAASPPRAVGGSHLRLITGTSQFASTSMWSSSVGGLGDDWAHTAANLLLLCVCIFMTEEWVSSEVNNRIIDMVSRHRIHDILAMFKMRALRLM